MFFKTTAAAAATTVIAVLTLATPAFAHDCFNPQKDAHAPTAGVNYTITGFDPVTGILFASVYRQFADLAELEAEVRRIKSEPVTAPGQLAIEQSESPSDGRGSMGHSPSRPVRGGKTTARETRRDHAARP